MKNVYNVGVKNDTYCECTMERWDNLLESQREIVVDKNHKIVFVERCICADRECENIEHRHSWQR